MRNTNAPSIDILGCRVDAIDRTETLERIARLANAGGAAMVVTLGVEMVMFAQGNERFRAILNSAALNVCDTIGLLLASRLRRGPLRHRVTGVELVADLAARSADRDDVRLFFLGGAGDTAECAARALQHRFPGAQIVGWRDGYFRAEDVADVARAIQVTGANVLCVGLGSPKQELWLAEHLASSGCGVGIGVGGSFDVLAGRVRRAPRLLQRAGLEWAYRLFREPRRWRRQLALPRFAFAAAREIFTRKEATGLKL